MNNILCIAGPTASGKTALAVELAKLTNGEVVSCDSMYIYRRMNVGTAKPTIEEMQAALRPEYIHLSQDHISITFPKGSLPSQEHGYGFGLSIFGQRWDALQEWAQPLPRE